MTGLLVLFFLSLFLLGYTFFGYPVFIFVLSKLRQKKLVRKPNDLTVSIVVPAHNEEDVIQEKIENLLALDFPKNRLQILVIDDGSTDNTAEIIKKYQDKGVAYYANIPRQGKVAALNLAMQAATGDIFVISDADITSDPNILTIILEIFSNPDVGCVVGKGIIQTAGSETGSSNSLYYKYDSKIKIAESQIHSTVGVSGHSMAIRRQLLHPIPTNIILDDFYLAMMVIKQGFRVIFEPKAVSYERPTVSMKDEIKRRQRITAGRYHIISMANAFFPQLPPLITLQVISHKFLRLFIPFFMLGALISNAALVGYRHLISPAWLSGFVILVFVLQILFYLSALLGRFAKSSGIKVKIFNLAYYLVATNWASLKGLYWFLSNKRTVLWDQAKRTEANRLN